MVEFRYNYRQQSHKKCLVRNIGNERERYLFKDFRVLKLIF